ncbi:MAG: hypothetical protein ABIT01_09035 [Thermoanaerobaculia bacterium]
MRTRIRPESVSSALRVLAAAALCATAAVAQPVPNPQLQSQPRAAVAGAQVQGALSAPPNVTNWGVVQRSGSKLYGKTGETIFVEGRDLNPATLELSTSIGGRSLNLTRKAGGTSSRVEFTIPSNAITGNLTAKLDTFHPAGQHSTLSGEFGICDQIRIVSISPASVGFDSSNLTEVGNVKLTQTVTFEGECLHELAFSQVRGTINSFRVGTATVELTPQSRSYNRVQTRLDLLIPTGGNQFQVFTGPIQLKTPATGPRFTIGDARGINSGGAPAPTATPIPFVAMTISGVEAQGPEFGGTPPFVIAVTDPEGPRWNNGIKINGTHLTEDAKATWKIGGLDLERVNRTSPPHITAGVPANAVSGKVCSTRNLDTIPASQRLEAAKSVCSPNVMTVVAGPKITQAPPGWPKYNVDRAVKVSLKVRQEFAITGFDFKPEGIPGLVAEVKATNFNAAQAAACNLDFKVLGFENNKIRVSFGQPGSARPAGCTEQQEKDLAFMTGPGSRGPVELQFRWAYNGTFRQIALWSVMGTP